MDLSLCATLMQSISNEMSRCRNQLFPATAHFMYSSKDEKFHIMNGLDQKNRPPCYSSNSLILSDG